MSCGCNQNPLVTYSNCEEETSDSGCLQVVDASCVEYNGDTLTCTSIEPGTRLESIIQAFDARLCNVTPDTDYTSFNTQCLEDIVDVKTFVETISTYVCTTRTDLDTFTDTTYPADHTALLSLINGIKAPSLTSCGSVGVGSGDTLLQVLTKHNTALCDLYTKTDISSASWDMCGDITNPTSITGGFNAVLTKVCAINTQISTLGDTYKVKLDVGDTTQDYLSTKLLGNGCITITPYLDTDGINKLVFSLGTTLQKYTFDSTQFSSTVIATGLCDVTRLVSIKPGVIPTLPPPVTCSFVDALYSPVVVGDTPLTGYLYANNGTTCKKIDKCGIMNWIGSGYTTGDYIIHINTSETGCSKVVLSALPDIPEAYVVPYKVYVAVMNQVSTSAPTVTVLENTLGGAIVWTRSGAGNYVGTLNDAFTINKTIVTCGTPLDGAIANFFRNDTGVNEEDSVFLNITDAATATALEGGFIKQMAIEIRVYP